MKRLISDIKDICVYIIPELIAQLGDFISGVRRHLK